MISPKNWLEQMQALEAGATAGPWEYDHVRDCDHQYSCEFETIGPLRGSGQIGIDSIFCAKSDAAFIAASRQFAPKALECIKELSGAVKMLECRCAGGPFNFLCTRCKLLAKWNLE